MDSYPIYFDVLESTTFVTVHDITRTADGASEGLRWTRSPSLPGCPRLESESRSLARSVPGGPGPGPKAPLGRRRPPTPPRDLNSILRVTAGGARASVTAPGPPLRGADSGHCIVIVTVRASVVTVTVKGTPRLPGQRHHDLGAGMLQCQWATRPTGSTTSDLNIKLLPGRLQDHDGLLGARRGLGCSSQLSEYRHGEPRVGPGRQSGLGPPGRDTAHGTRRSHEYK